ncbi:phage antirepressor protein [Pseudomonas sp. CCI1.1]|uniref:phage antirepressor protein n=1 Tax=Pseudomonas sp. CCI1.1 TaxID=3048613 RepID=UPI002AC8ECB4|nr:phage antirepressor protein [Pseudomonas sp. CCI1.1]MEB0189987.1 phage antirepressor protein [Pseudomonas sp. CCI1.1]WPX48386.1 phage antirepressor protein [Pseudomonas sp. CCI1.1]
MHTSNTDVQALNNPAPRFLQSQNVARTMSSVDLRDLVNDARTRAGESKVRNDQFIIRVEDELSGELGVCSFIAHPQSGVMMASYDLTLDQCTLVGMRESKAVRRTVLKKIKDLEGPKQLSTIEILQIAMESEKARLMLTAQVEQQATKIHSLENLFKEGMTHTQFCKGLNGVNVMQVGNYLEGRSWLYNESKSGTRHRVGSYARDKYMTEHQVEVTPHGKEPFISYTPILLKKGAARLYDLYLAGELPMKKTWDGLFAHDKAMRGAA